MMISVPSCHRLLCQPARCWSALAHSILMGKHSNIGPVDPQINGIPCVAVVEEVKKAYAEIAKDQRTALFWSLILSKLSPSFLLQCESSIENSKCFLRKVLKDGMLRDLSPQEKRETAERITERLTDLSPIIAIFIFGNAPRLASI